MNNGVQPQIFYIFVIKTKAFIRIQIRIQGEAWIQTPDSSKPLDPNSVIWIRNTDLDSAGSRVADPDPNCIRIQSGHWIRLRKLKSKFHVLKSLMFSFES
jgi:hypothetical protein